MQRNSVTLDCFRDRERLLAVDVQSRPDNLGRVVLALYRLAAATRACGKAFRRSIMRNRNATCGTGTSVCVSLNRFLWWYRNKKCVNAFFPVEFCMQRQLLLRLKQRAGGTGENECFTFSSELSNLGLHPGTHHLGPHQLAAVALLTLVAVAVGFPVRFKCLPVRMRIELLRDDRGRFQMIKPPFCNEDLRLGSLSRPRRPDEDHHLFVF